MTGEPAHKEIRVLELMFSSEHMLQLSITDSKVKWSLRFILSYVQPIPQRYIQN